MFNLCGIMFLQSCLKFWCSRSVVVNSEKVELEGRARGVITNMVQMSPISLSNLFVNMAECWLEKVTAFI